MTWIGRLTSLRPAITASQIAAGDRLERLSTSNDTVGRSRPFALRSRILLSTVVPEGYNNFPKAGGYPGSRRA